jgi:peptidoglycan/xylan/chitin deacetylase (PgdA/CDA1 family)
MGLIKSFVYFLALVGAATLAYLGFDGWLSATGRKTAPSVVEKLAQKAPQVALSAQPTPPPANAEVLALVQTLREAEIPTTESIAQQDRVNSLTPSAQNATGPIRMWPTGRRRVALTFDDGPNPTITPRLLDLLESKQARATFFLLGNSLRAHPDIARRLVDAGMEVANHSMTHPALPRQSEAVIRRELSEMNQLIGTKLNRSVHLMRPPYGAVNSRVQAISEELGLKIVNWSVDTDDWRSGMSEERMKRRIADGLQDGAIILMHDRFERTLNTTAWAIDEIRKQGFELVTVSELLGLKPQTVLVPELENQRMMAGSEVQPEAPVAVAPAAEPVVEAAVTAVPGLPSPGSVPGVSMDSPLGSAGSPIAPVAVSQQASGPDSVRIQRGPGGILIEPVRTTPRSAEMDQRVSTASPAAPPQTPRSTPVPIPVRGSSAAAGPVPVAPVVELSEDVLTPLPPTRNR